MNPHKGYIGQSLLIALIACLFPIIGLIVAVPFFARKSLIEQSYAMEITDENPGRGSLLKALIIFTVILVLFGIIRLIGWQHFWELWIYVGLSATFFAYLLPRIETQQRYEIAILGGAVPGLFYITIKNLFFFDSIKAMYEDALSKSMESLESFVAPGQLETILPKMEKIMLYGNASIWMFGIIIGLAIGALIFSYRVPFPKWNYHIVRFPPVLWFGIIAGLILVILRQQVIGFNLLAICGAFYLIEGYSVLYFFIKNFYENHKVLGTIILIIPLLSIIVLGAVALLGLIDNLVNIRKFQTSGGNSP
ncbi:MAG: DUF2232 domain-containing protein [Candidatus Cloacimonadia bacterium]